MLQVAPRSWGWLRKTEKDWERLRKTEKDWERLGMAGNGCVFQGTSGLRDFGILRAMPAFFADV